MITNHEHMIIMFLTVKISILKERRTKEQKNNREDILI